ncbi:GNAT family N-acetyltransferase [Synechococcus sp. UW140]|uniref:GNAT family N-acetyltransferase n=1 Tax=Synechococcus sp. UW140 TaxID=368503 RepID=UPI003137ED81
MSDKSAYSINLSGASEITAHLFRVDAGFEPTLSSRVDIRAYAQKLHDRAVRFEAWMGEELVGLVASYCNQPDGSKAFVTSVSVWPEFQGQGIAGRLMRECIEHVRGLEVGQIELEVDKLSLSAIALYQNLGFNMLRETSSTFIMIKILERKAL